ncbi:MAG TPA: sugar ABC transporter ATP-binding protein [Tepidisphaeraceae bacterium]|jgi:ribose transport system ATP-binding protein|nr:sugar ABC transporter ATP-binding protein [Tepidisphaeraceae bacterium]
MLLEAVNISKSFPGVLALKDVSFSLEKGEVLAVIGENGAGKSTLMRILAGVQAPDSGAILLDGKAVTFPTVQSALRLGIVLIHQELNLSDNLDVAANIFLGREPRRFGLIDKPRLRRNAAAVLERICLDCSPDTIVSDLSIGHQQMVEIAKALSVDARILIMDEPTSSLSQHETEQLFRVVRDLRSKGISVLYISHRLGEVKELADRVLVLRDGKVAGQLSHDQINHERMVRLMVGREISGLYDRKANIAGAIMLEVTKLRTPAHPAHEINFSVGAGEIVGIAGLVGAGRTEVLQTLFGITPALGGTIRVGESEVSINSPRDAIRSGIALVPEDRKQHGLILELAVRENLSLPSLRRTQFAGFLNYSQERQLSRRTIDELGVRTPSDAQICQYLSGGNQQKVVVGKWLATKPKILLLDEPTRGIDIGAKQEVYKLMEQLAASGVAILFVSSELEEILRMSDRTLVMHEGRLTGQLPRSQLTEESIMRLATGGTNSN